MGNFWAQGHRYASERMQGLYLKELKSPGHAGKPTQNSPDTPFQQTRKIRS